MTIATEDDYFRSDHNIENTLILYLLQRYLTFDFLKALEKRFMLDSVPCNQSIILFLCPTASHTHSQSYTQSIFSTNANNAGTFSKLSASSKSIELPVVSMTTFKVYRFHNFSNFSYTYIYFRFDAVNRVCYLFKSAVC